jgi:hypothetical protein
MTINIKDYEYFEYWLDSGKTATHIAIVVTIVDGIRNESDFHLFRSSKDYFIDIFGFRFRRSDGCNTGDCNVFIILSTITPIVYFKPSHSFSRD